MKVGRLRTDALGDRRSALASVGAENRWAVILAGGDGTRLQGLTKFICGDDRPKQFCPLLGRETLLAHTVRRAERSIPREHILFALTRTHREFYVQELAGSEANRIVQPANKGTAPPILFGVRSIEQIDENALVAILPSDHHYSDEARFTRTLESAFGIAAERPESVVVVGAQPDRLEVEYGWIELGPSLTGDASEVRRVHGFWEKPHLEVARELLGKDSVWNTFVMAGHVRAFLELGAHAIPDVLESLKRVPVWNGFEAQIEESIYDSVRPTDFSRHVLSMAVARLLVLRVRDLGWSDLGHPGRVLSALEQGRRQPPWMKAWKETKSLETVGHSEVASAVA